MARGVDTNAYNSARALRSKLKLWERRNEASGQTFMQLARIDLPGIMFVFYTGLPHIIKWFIVYVHWMACCSTYVCTVTFMFDTSTALNSFWPHNMYKIMFLKFLSRYLMDFRLSVPREYPAKSVV